MYILPNDVSTDYRQEIADLLSEYDSISLKGLDAVQLLNRIDTKFIFHASHLPDLLREISGDYYVLEIENKRAFRYSSLYYDTSDFQLYKFHHNGKLNRLKVRSRTYLDSGLCYFEVKYKVNGGLRTRKERLKIPNTHETLSSAENQLIYHPQINNNDLQASLWVNFTRITLASRQMNERLTIDLELQYDQNGQIQNLHNLAIAEIKTNKTSYLSPIVKALKARHFEESGFSKYAIGIALLAPVKYNNFKPQLLKVAHILNT